MQLGGGHGAHAGQKSGGRQIRPGGKTRKRKRPRPTRPGVRPDRTAAHRTATRRAQEVDDTKREDEYRQQLQELGVYEPAFAPAIHDLVVTEHEYSRAMKAWRQDAKDRGALALTSDDLYTPVLQLRREIQAQREALGLTPRGLQKLRGKPRGEGGVAGEAMSRKLDAILARIEAYE